MSALGVLERSAVEAASAAGLVSVPTTPRRGAAVEAVALREALGVFVPDVQASRLARLRRSIGFAARAHAVSERGRRNDVPWMVTLTYAGTNDDWGPEHLTRAIDCFRFWCKAKGFACRYVWVAELQQRGVIHYHLCCWLPKGVRMPKWDVRTSHHRLSRRWWPHGMTNRKVARHAVAYLMKYMSKGSAGTLGSFPKGARVYGVGGLEVALRRARRWLGLPGFIQARADCSERWERAQGGGWIDPGGVIWPSEYRRVYAGDAWGLERVCDHGRPFDAAGPFSWVQ